MSLLNAACRGALAEEDDGAPMQCSPGSPEHKAIVHGLNLTDQSGLRRREV
jgi:hypothetical protein